VLIAARRGGDFLRGSEVIGYRASESLYSRLKFIDRKRLPIARGTYDKSIYVYSRGEKPAASLLLSFRRKFSILSTTTRKNGVQVSTESR
jgi:hypothetical protein